MANCLSRRDQKVHLIFQKLYPSGHQGFLFMVPKWKEVFIRMDSLLTMITNSSRVPLFKNLETFFIFSFSFSALKLILSLKTSAKSRWQKHLTHKSIYFMQMLTSKECLHLSKVHSKMEAFMNKNKETAPQLVLYLNTNR